MPFTAAHPAAVLPLRRLCPRHLCWSALVVGALAPDFEYFLLLRPQVGHGHTLAGSLYFCLPLGAIALLIFHGVVKRPLTLLLPRSETARLWPLANTPFRPRGSRWLVIAASLLLGTWTHLVWDAFTHRGRWGTERLPFLNTTLFTIDDYRVTVFKLLQHGGTLLGVTVLLWSYLAWRRRTPPRESAPSLPAGFRHVVLTTAVMTTLAMASARAWAVCGPIESFAAVRGCVGVFVIGAIASGGIVLVAVSLVVSIVVGRRFSSRA